MVSVFTGLQVWRVEMVWLLKENEILFLEKGERGKTQFSLWHTIMKET